MELELWMPDRVQLKKMTDDLMDRRMGTDWRTFWDPSDDVYVLKAMVRREDSCFIMTAGDLSSCGKNFSDEGTSCDNDPWAGTMTEELYRDAWGTALMDAGRKLLKSYIDDRRYALKGPGLGGVPNEIMKGLYEALEGWRIGVKINEYYVLIPDKSFGGWFEPMEEIESVGPERFCNAGELCHPGVGCQFCMKRNAL